MKYWKVFAVLTFLQLILGITITVLAIRASDFSTSLGAKDLPLWASGPLVVSGCIGVLFVLGCRNSFSENTSVFVIKGISYLTSCLSVVLCFVAATFNSIHVVLYLENFYSCTDSENHSACVCLRGTQPLHIVYTYEDISCEGVFNGLYNVFIVLAVLNSLGGLTCLCYVILLWSTRYNYIYGGVTGSDCNELA
ncbi:sarcospan-like [Limulus polyphemus]|uniref:Sarcospan-like n=1 Tax=Limulus polyphemus TaxID=6850 RepID=A0ABM1SIB8_LIMPO|nr:sarcospan-like [Limulus polyphemus]XP_022243371.1 sarcospan-like [Limulus polyphemus]XP_022243372.1 sarcospan-like [Limulus polyphemus]XP_022243373.1 sarcospan-like [Limulus polyphemus]